MQAIQREIVHEMERLKHVEDDLKDKTETLNHMKQGLNYAHKLIRESATVVAAEKTVKRLKEQS